MIFPCPSALIILHSHWISVCCFTLVTNFLHHGLEGDVLIPLPPFSLQSPVPNFCHMYLYLEYHFLSQYRIPCQDFGESRFQKSGKIPYLSTHLAFSRIPLYIGQIPDPENMTIGEGRSWSRFPPPFSRQSRIPTISHLYPEYRFLSQYRIPCHDFGESRFPKSGKISYPVKKFCVILFTEFRVIFRPIPGSREYFSRPCSHVFFLWESLIVFSQWHRRLERGKIRVLRPPAAEPMTFWLLKESRCG